MSAKQAINGKLQGSVATYLMCGWVVNNQIKNGLVSEWILLIGEYLAKLQVRPWLSRALCAPGQHTAKDEESARDNHVFASNFAKYSPILIFFDSQTQH